MWDFIIKILSNVWLCPHLRINNFVTVKILHNLFPG